MPGLVNGPVSVCAGSMGPEIPDIHDRAAGVRIFGSCRACSVGWCLPDQQTQRERRPELPSARRLGEPGCVLDPLQDFIALHQSPSLLVIELKSYALTTAKLAIGSSASSVLIRNDKSR